MMSQPLRLALLLPIVFAACSQEKAPAEPAVEVNLPTVFYYSLGKN